MRPGTIDYSRWDALVASSDEEEASQHQQQASSPPRVMPTAPAAATAAAQLEQLSLVKDDPFCTIVQALVANEGAMRVLGGLQLEELDSADKLARLSPEMAQAMRDVLLAGGAARGLARLAMVSCFSRGACSAVSSLRAAVDYSIAPRRDDIVRSIVAYASSIPANEEDSMLSMYGDDATRVLRLLANWPPPPPTNDGLSAADVKLRDLTMKWLAPASQTRRARLQFDLLEAMTGIGVARQRMDDHIDRLFDEQERAKTAEPAPRGRRPRPPPPPRLLSGRVKEGKFLLHLAMLGYASGAA